MEKQQHSAIATLICLEFNNNNRAGAVTPAESEKDMLQLTEIFDLLGRKEFVIITEKENKLYYGECEKCPIDIWRNAHIKEMKFNNKKEIYIIDVRYM